MNTVTGILDRFRSTARPDRQVAFVLSDMRSGSTLLDQLLGAHPDMMSLGELHWLPAYVTQDRGIYDPAHELICTCGKSIAECEFWSQAARRLGRPLESLRLQLTLTRNQQRVLDRFPRIFRNRILQDTFTGTHFVDDNIALLDCLFEVSRRRVLVDSSKSAYRFRAVYGASPRQTRGLILTRDYRAVVFSKLKRGHSLESAAIGWRNKMRQIEALTDDLPPGHVHRLSYEDLCRDTVTELTRLCSFLGLTFEATMLERSTAGIHHIGGSPSKFDHSRVAIEMDTAYKTAFSALDLTRIATLVGATAERWGY